MHLFYHFMPKAQSNDSIHTCIESHRHMPKAQNTFFFTHRKKEKRKEKKNTFKVKRYPRRGLVQANNFAKHKNKMVYLQRNKLQALYQDSEGASKQK